MSFDTLLWIIIIAVYILGFVLKRVFTVLKKGKTESVKARPEWREKLDQFLAQVRQEMEQKGPNRENERTKLPPPQKDELEPALTDTETVDSPFGPAREPISPERSEYVPGETVSLTNKIAAEKRDRIVSVKRRRPDVLTWGMKDLKKTIVWAEILAPPLALRDREGPGQ